MLSARLLALPAALLATFSSPVRGDDYKIHKNLSRALTGNSGARGGFFVVFGARPNLSMAKETRNWGIKGTLVVQALQREAARAQSGVRALLQSRNIQYTPFWVQNAIFIPTGDINLARELARRPEVAAIRPNAQHSIPTPRSGTASAANGIEWSIRKIRADQVWPETKGAGIVVSNIDTGVQFTHPALVSQYRGNRGGGTFVHAGNWRDPSDVCGSPGSPPCDNYGHGTHTMGTMAGDDGGSNQIGVAPQAKWIACKGCESRSCSEFALVSCAQWVLDPLGNGSGANRPHVVNNSWGGRGGDPWYQTFVQNWRAAGLFPAFSIGNNGPDCSTTGDPGDYAESFASGATDISDTIAWFSSRGPAPFGLPALIKPNVAAPGVNVRSSVPEDGYSDYSGTSMASPHTAGVVALIWSAVPSYIGDISSTEAIIARSAMPLQTNESCGGSAGQIPNNTYGFGRIDAFDALRVAKGLPINRPPVVRITAPFNGGIFACPATVFFSGTANDNEDGDLSAQIRWTDNGRPFGTGTSASKSYSCTDPPGTHVIVAAAQDSAGASDTDTIAITLFDSRIPNAPGRLSATIGGPVVMLNWVDNSSGEQGFRIYRGGGPTPAWQLIGTAGMNQTTYSDFPPKGAWQYRVTAYSGLFESEPSSPVNAKI